MSTGRSAAAGCAAATPCCGSTACSTRRPRAASGRWACRRSHAGAGQGDALRVTVRAYDNDRRGSVVTGAAVTLGGLSATSDAHGHGAAHAAGRRPSAAGGDQGRHAAGVPVDRCGEPRRIMTLRRGTAALLAVAALTAVAAGCRLGPQAEGSGASLTVTRDYGAKVIARASENDLPAGETAMRLLQRNADVDTRYGGRFVNAIESVRSSTTGGRHDWFYYVNGIEADRSAAEKRLHDGDRVWWDYRDWTAAMRVPGGRRLVPGAVRAWAGRQALPRADRLRRRGGQDACRDVLDRLDRAGVTAEQHGARRSGGQGGAAAGGGGVERRAQATRRYARSRRGRLESGVFARIGPGDAGLRAAPARRRAAASRDASTAGEGSSRRPGSRSSSRPGS